jgi:putative phosphoesterase
MLIGVISDTHDFFDPHLPQIFSAVDHILHAGDVGRHRILHQLEQIAPVTAVLGNNDVGLPCNEFENVSHAGVVFFLQHIVNPLRLDRDLGHRLELVRPGVVIFGHTHRQYSVRHNGVLFLNPGYAGSPRVSQPRSVATVKVLDGDCEVTFHALPD